MPTITDTQTSSKEISNFGFNGSVPNTLAAGLYGVKAYKEFTAPDVNYDILQLKAGGLENEADSIMLKATAEANIARQQFSGAIGTFTANAARRNVKVGEGGMAQNIEMSARDFGMDMKEMKDNAAFRAEQIRAEADRVAMAAEDQKEVSKWERYGSLFDTVGDLVSIDYSSITKKEEPKKEDTTKETGKKSSGKKSSSKKIYGRKGQASMSVGR